MAISSATTKTIIAASRQKCATGDHFGALHVLRQMLRFSEPAGAIQAELIRVHLIHGDRKSASLVVAETPGASHRNANPYHDLVSILAAYINVSVCGDLAPALQVAASMWQEHGTAAAFKDGDEVLVSTQEQKIFH
jgi:hypothetical protein